MYQRSKMLAEKETESCLQCLSKVDELIFKKTGEHMPQPAAALAGNKRPMTGHDGMGMGMGNGAGPSKRQSLTVDTCDLLPATPLTRPQPAPVAKTPKAPSVEKQAADAERREAAKKKAEAKEKKIEAEEKLHLAAKTNNVEMAKECLALGVDVNKAKGGWCALHFAASKNAPEVARLLCENGADVNVTSSKDGWSAMIWACSMNNVEVAKILINAKADVDKPGSKDGSTPLGWCAFKESVEVAELLLQANADVTASAQDKVGNSALHWASTRNACGVARLLLKYGARLDLQNKEGKTPITIETAGAEVLKILKGEDPGVASDPARAPPVTNQPVAAHQAKADTGAGVSESKPDPNASTSTASATVGATAGTPSAAAGSTPLASQPSTGCKTGGGGGKGLASAPGSRPDESDSDSEDSDSEEDGDAQAPDSLATGGGSADGGASTGKTPAGLPMLAQCEITLECDDVTCYESVRVRCMRENACVDLDLTAWVPGLAGPSTATARDDDDESSDSDDEDDE
jgi:ankyrin repeat protein